MNFITWFVKTYKIDILGGGIPLAIAYFILAGFISGIAGSWILFSITYVIGFSICAPVLFVLLKEQWDKLYSRYKEAHKE